MAAWFRVQSFVLNTQTDETDSAIKKSAKAGKLDLTMAGGSCRDRERSSEEFGLRCSWLAVRRC
jgi:hypothetical protein